MRLRSGRHLRRANCVDALPAKAAHPSMQIIWLGSLPESLERIDAARQRGGGDDPLRKAAARQRCLWLDVLR